jgi:hypothetical protein
MKVTTKAGLLFCCFLLCGLGAVLSPKGNATERDSKTDVVPVNNRQPHRGIWLRV